MSTWQVALVREQGVEFAVICVQDHVLDNPTERTQLATSWARELGRPTVLLGARRHQLFGRPDIVRFLSHIDPSRLPWRQITIAA